MKILFFIAFIALSTFNPSFAQNQHRYSELISEAYNFYENKEYQKSAEKFKEAFDEAENVEWRERYNAACSYVLSNDLENAFYHLFLIARKPYHYKKYDHIIQDSDLIKLHDDKRWDELISLIKANQEDAEKYFDWALIAHLDTVYNDDQKYRKQIGEVIDKFGMDSKERKAVSKQIVETDSINLVKVSEILDERGWLGPEIIGDKGGRALFLVIQHADNYPEKQLKYLAILKEAVEKGDAKAYHQAYLEDRVAVNHGKKQVYGTQMDMDPETEKYFVYPLVDPDNVDERRSKVGLEPMNEYLNFWEITWDVEEYKEWLEERKVEKDGR